MTQDELNAIRQYVDNPGKDWSEWHPNTPHDFRADCRALISEVERLHDMLVRDETCPGCGKQLPPVYQFAEGEEPEHLCTCGQRYWLKGDRWVQ